MKDLKKEQIKALVLGVVSIVVGLLFCIFRIEMFGMVETLVCFGLLGFGVIEIIIYCVVNTDSRSPIILVRGAIATFFALLIIFVNAVLVVALALIIVLSGVVYIRSAIQDKKDKVSNWALGLVLGVALIVAGVVSAVLYNTSIAKDIVMPILGLTFIADGIIRLIFVFVLHKEIRLIIEKVEQDQTVTDVENKSDLDDKTISDDSSVEKVEKNVNRKDVNQKDIIETDENKNKTNKTQKDSKKDKKSKIENQSVQKDDEETLTEGFIGESEETEKVDEIDDTDDTEGFV